ncbi:WxL domain-containing protein [Desertibacillus haloalkaliphilus]|uniref:WxL domain-containing protein n=1 Tax=Desertibacillus haloalkaliphilus TaxID=1328930 RepID=UPI001C25F195|nr:WxL domain-containing protein [Desertibacillus haloalkaliphilus]MBU8906028.1 WxL domain-containing protein [Desertibacillus haloalkaliphilus]
MSIFSHQEIRHEENDYSTLILYINPRDFMVEFANELGIEPKNEISTQAIKHAKKHFPDLKLKTIKVMVGSLVLSSVIASPLMLTDRAHASTTDDTRAEVTGGTYELGTLTVGTFTAVVLDGKTQNTFSTINAFPVGDATGTGGGWNVVLKASPFTLEGTEHTLPEGSLTVSAPTVEKVDEGSSSLETITRSSGPIDTAEGIKVLSAADGGGMGSYNVSFDDKALDLTLLPRDARSGTYTSTITATLNVGP